ncbi:MAG TPA: CBS domain-containing protein [Enhygromyxa sp.]|nr:CBS domain-containing protein [Enhygromyxa sp.]
MQRNVGAVCIREVVVAEATEPVLELARLMRHYHVGDVVIVTRRGDKRYPTGMVTDRDIVVDALVTSLDSIGELMASDLVNRPVITVREDQCIDDALEIMRKNGVRRVPVVDQEGALVGIVAVDDLVEFFADRLSELAILFSREQRIERGVRP